MKTLLFAAAILLLLAQVTSASKEGVLAFSKFTIQSEGIGQSGVVIVEGVKNASGSYQKLTVKAFGKAIEVSEDLLQKIPSRYQNGIQLSYEAGYEVLGGRTIYITFLSGSTAGIDEIFTIEVKENGKQGILNSP